MMVHHCAASEASGRSLQEVPLLKGSFGHHSAIGGLGNSSSQESLYGNQRHHIMTSGSLHSIRSSRPAHQPGHAPTSAASIPVTAEIVPVPMQNSQADQANVILASSASSGAITSSSFMPSIAVSEAAAASAAVSVSGSTTNTLPRSLENGYNRGRLDSLTSTPVFIQGNLLKGMENWLVAVRSVIQGPKQSL